MKLSHAVLVGLFFLASCATSTIETRKKEKFAQYEMLPQDQKKMVDAGQVRVGMSQEAVYIAWGAPSEVLETEDKGGHRVIWRFYGTDMQENRYWAYREVSRDGKPDLFLERYLVSDYTPRDYVRSEIIFNENKVESWRTLPRPGL